MQRGEPFIYGIAKPGGLPQALDGLNPATISKEWLEQVIHGRIQPRLEVHINPISLRTQHPSRVAYVVTIAQGRTAHQASDHKYYKRHNFHSVPMEDHEIRDMMARSRHPIIEPVFTFRENSKKELELGIVLRNIGTMRARDIKIVVALPQGMFSSQYSQFAVGTTHIDGKNYSSYSFQKSDAVIFPDDEAPLTDTIGPIQSTGRIATMDIYLSPLYDLRWKRYGDDMPPKEGRILFKDIPAR